MSSAFAGGWLSLATGPYGGAFVIGLLLGALASIWLWQKFVVDPKMKTHEANCQVQLAALQEKVDSITPIAERWNQFMEKKAFELLDMNRIG